MTSGYYRFPTIYREIVVFVSEDDLWSVSTRGGMARRLTSNLGEVSYPMLSPDGVWLAFVGREEGMTEVYVMPATGGTARRLTYLSSSCRVVGWTPDSSQIVFTSNHGQPVTAEMALFQIAADATNGEVTALPYGTARSLAFGPHGGVVLGRNTGDPARWKRYRGGTAGHLWVDQAGDGDFVRLLPELPGNIASPMWLVAPDAAADEPGRVYFVSDHEGVGNLYSCRPDGADLERHTDHEDYYVRNPSSDGLQIVYHVGADLFVFDPLTTTSTRVDVDYLSPRVQRNRKFADAGRYLDGYSLHPSGQALGITTRGKAYTFFAQEGPVVQYGKRDGVRYRDPVWLHDGRRLLLVSDEPGEETLEIYHGQPNRPPERLEGLEIGRIVEIKASPHEDKVALTNHRYELILVDLAAKTLEVIDRSAFVNISGFDWSPDGAWIAYSFGATSRTSEIRLYQLPTEEEGAPAELPPPDGGPLPLTPRGRRHTVTRPVLHDVRPAFDPEGKHLYFLSYREFNPVYDGLHFDLGFPWGMRPYLITLRADLPNPFIPVPELGDEADEEDDESHGADEDEDDTGDEDGAEDDESGEDEDAGDDEDDDAGEEDADSDADEPVGDDSDETDFWRSPYWLRGGRTGFGIRQTETRSKGKKTAAAKDAGGSHGGRGGKADKRQRRMRIDLDGIEQRVVAFPVPDARYGQIAGIPGKAIFTVFPIQGQLDDGVDWGDEEDETGTLRAYDFKEYKSETLAENVVSFELSANHKRLVYWSRNQLRVIPAGEKAPGGGGYTRKSGWVNLGRVKVSIDPQSEWEQMFREAWRLQRDHFWTEDMSEVDWQIVYHRYYALIPRISTRGEFSDLMWEMQGELGTSHAYEFGGDYRHRPFYGQGYLGADLRWDAEAQGYRVTRLILGDPWDAEANSPLAAPGVDVQPGDLIVAINGQALDANTGPAQLLVNQGGNEVLLSLREEPDAADIPTTDGQAATDSAADGPVDADTTGAASTSGTPDETPQMAEVDEEERAEIAKALGAAVEAEHLPDAAPPAGGMPSSPSYRTVVVKAIHSEAPAYYRNWVNENRRKVHGASNGRVGYVHIPDMGPSGYAEFHRGYLAEVDRDGLIVDVRYNGGGHVSQLIMEKLARRRLGYDLSRWGGLVPYPVESISGPLVALTNEHAGSDGDIFCHSFKMMKLGPLVGKRTWGGVIGIAPRHMLVDGTITTQPEYSFWFEDVGWNVENYGTDPDIEVDITPQDYRRGVDPQLDRAVQEAMRLLNETPRKLPELTTKPSRALPKLPPRTLATGK